MEWRPKGYHKRGLDLLTKEGGSGLLLDPGMGKTSTALAAFQMLRWSGQAYKMLVIAPIKPMYGTWPAEILKWDEFRDLRVVVLHGKNKEEDLSIEADVYIINPEGIKWYFSHKEKELPDTTVLCVDESTKFKNFTAKRTKLLRRYLGWFDYRWILTGTVCPNGLMDLFSQVFIMDRGKALGRFITHYRQTYFYKPWEGSYDWIPHDGAMESISEKIAPMVLKLEAEDYLDMPELMVVQREVTLTDKVKAVYEQVEREFIVQMQDRTVVAPSTAAAGNKCRQIANGAMYDNEGEVIEIHNKKLEALEELVEETNGHPLLILYEFKHDRDRIMELLGKEAVCITGVTGRQLDKVIVDFNKGRIPYLVAHPGTTHGMNIQGHCFHMIWFCITWNLEHYIQAVWRLYRQGQTSKVVMCYHLIAKDTVDERVVKVLDHKKTDQDRLEAMLMREGE